MTKDKQNFEKDINVPSKQMIIVGCDVSGCEFYNNVIGEDAYCNIDEEHLLSCISYDNCYYKQLKAKEQECEKLETARHLIETSRYMWEYRAKSKERECESLNRWLPIISRLEKAFGSYEKAKAIDYKSYIEQIFAELDQLKAELETLKQYKASKQASYESMQREWNNAVNENRELKAEIETLKSFDINLVGIKECEIRQLVQYRKTLTEIKEIAEKIDDSSGCAYGDYDCDNCSSLEQETVCTYKVKKLILQKISEVDNVPSN